MHAHTAYETCNPRDLGAGTRAYGTCTELQGYTRRREARHTLDMHTGHEPRTSRDLDAGEALRFQRHRHVGVDGPQMAHRQCLALARLHKVEVEGQAQGQGPEIPNPSGCEYTEETWHARYGPARD